MQTLCKNMLGGLRIALLLPLKPGAFTATWRALWCIVAVYAVLAGLIDFVNAEPPRDFDVGGFARPFSCVAAVLLASFLLAGLFRDNTKILTLAVMSCNAFFPLWCGAEVLDRWAPDGWWVVEDAASVVAAVWCYLIAFRILARAFDPGPVLQLVGAGMLAASVLVPVWYFSVEHFWYHDFTADKRTALEETTSEELFAMQPALLQKQLDALKSAVPGKTEMFGVVFGSYGYQDVFMREVRFVRAALEKEQNMAGRTIAMINNDQAFQEYPLASVTGLRAALKALGARIQPQEDIVLLYLTSHGSRNELSVTLSGRNNFIPVTSFALKDILKESGIRNAVIIISACHSGSLIAPLEDEDTLVITSAAADRRSFGCGSDSEMTYFADAYFGHALPEARNLIDAFDVARKRIEEREANEKLEASLPQMAAGSRIVTLLAGYSRSLRQ